MSELPKGWVEVTLGDVVQKIIGGGTPARGISDYWSGDIPWFSVKDMRSRRPNDSKEHITGKAIQESSTNLIPANTLVVATRMGLGKIIRIPCDATINQDLKALVIKDETLRAFVEHWYRSQVRLLENLGTGTTVKGIRIETLKAIALWLPPLKEQHRIVAKLESCEARISVAREAMDDLPKLLQQYRQSVLAAAFRGDLTRDWRAAHPDVEPAESLLARLRIERCQRWEQNELAKYQQKDKDPPKNWQQKYKEPEPLTEQQLANLPEIPEGWCWTTLETVNSAVDTICYGVVQPGEDDPNGPRLVRVLDVTKGEVHQDRLRGISSAVARKYDRSKLKGGEVLISIVGSIGRTAVVPTALAGANIARALARIVTVIPIDPFWIANVLRVNWIQGWLIGESREVARKTLNLAQLVRCPIPIAPIEEQKEIISYLNVFSDVTSNIEKHTSELSSDHTTLTQSLLAKAFRGELIPQDASDEPAAVLLDKLRVERSSADSNKPPPKKSSRKSTKPHKAIAVMTKTRFDKDVEGKPYLANILINTLQPLTAEGLFSTSEMKLVDFYKQLEWEISQGFIKDDETKLEAKK